MNPETTIVVKNILLWILIVGGIFAVTALGILLLNIAKAVKSANKVLEDNRVEIDHSLHVVPKVLENVEEITSSIGQITVEAEPNVAMILDNLSEVSSKVNRMTGTVEDATNSVASGVKDLTNGVKKVGDNAIDAVNTLVSSAQNISDSIKIKFYKKEQGAAEKALSLIEKLKNMIG